jgi:hypothetical protein
LSRKRKSEDETADYKKKLDAIMSCRKAIINPIPFNRIAIGQNLKIRRANNPDMSCHHRKNGDKAQAINLGDENPSGSGDA